MRLFLFIVGYCVLLELQWNTTSYIKFHFGWDFVQPNQMSTFLAFLVMSNIDSIPFGMVEAKIAKELCNLNYLILPKWEEQKSSPCTWLMMTKASPSKINSRMLGCKGLMIDDWKLKLFCLCIILFHKKKAKCLFVIVWNFIFNVHLQTLSFLFMLCLFLSKNVFF